MRSNLETPSSSSDKAQEIALLFFLSSFQPSFTRSHPLLFDHIYMPMYNTVLTPYYFLKAATAATVVTAAAAAAAAEAAEAAVSRACSRYCSAAPSRRKITDNRIVGRIQSHARAWFWYGSSRPVWGFLSCKASFFIVFCCGTPYMEWLPYSYGVIFVPLLQQRPRRQHQQSRCLLFALAQVEPRKVNQKKWLPPSQEAYATVAGGPVFS